VKQGYPDATAFDPKHHHYDAGSRPGDPRWYCVDIKLVRKFDRIITLDALRKHAGGALAKLVLLRRGNRLSVMPVTSAEWNFIVALE